MGRKSFNSKRNFLAATTLKPKAPSRGKSLADQIMETKLRSEQAKLALLEDEVPAKNPKYTRWVDMPPPTPEDEADFHRRFREILHNIAAEPIGPEEGESVQEWLTGQGAIIPDTPDWETPLYIEKWVRVGTKKQSD